MRFAQALTSLLPAVATLLHAGAAQSALASRLFPHLLIPIHDKYPQQAYGTQYFGEVGTYTGGEEAGHLVDTLILFDMPANFSETYHHCAISFTLNSIKDNWRLDTSGTPDTHYVFLVYQLLTLTSPTDTWDTPRTFTQTPAATITVSPNGAVVVESQKLACGGGPWNTANFIMVPADYRAKLWWYELADPLNGITYDMYQ